MNQQPAGSAERPTVILVRPQEQGNVGAVARAMANMGFRRLILVEPAVTIGRRARAFAVKAEGILDESRRVESLAEAIAPFRRVIGTTSSRARLPGAEILDARRLAERLAATPPVATALVFGPEASGLTTDELALCSAWVTIPCDAAQPTLNLAQAVLLVTYELALAASGGPATTATGEPPAAAASVEGLFDQAEPLLREIGFARDDTFGAVLRDLRRLAARAEPTEREVAILRGICRRAAGELARRGSFLGGAGRSPNSDE